MNMQPEVTTLKRPPAFQRQMKKTVIAVIIFAILLFISVTFVDRPVLRYAVHHRRFAELYELMATPSLLPLPLSILYLIVFAFGKLSGRPQNAGTNLYLAVSMATIVANSAKDELKFLIGRPWPAEWLNAGVYHLQPFTDSVYFGGFPSGHTTYIAAPMFVLWWRLPQYRPLWAALIASVMIGLVGYGFHFVGDVIGGLFLGMAVAAATVAWMPAGQLRR
jgi:membrane-associated phospholipid phosphatase